MVRRIEDDWLYLLLRAYNYWDFPKGRVESGEDPVSAALREVAEEAALKQLLFSWGPVFRETQAYGRGKIARYYVAESASGDVQLLSSPELGRPEHHEFRWLAYREARGLLVARVAAILDWAHAVVNDPATPR